MKEEDKLIEKYGRGSGFSVPDGYFETMRKEVAEKLPPLSMPEFPVNRTFWGKVKPYVYLAAMFAGIWVMMNIFNRVSPVDNLNLDNPPENIAIAMADMEISEIAGLPKSVSDFQIESEVSEQYASIEEFEEAFDYDFKDEYADIKIN